jgi:glycoprotein 6-alpha-L-fucosyltransferase
MPSSIPKDLAERITRLHGHPPSWWVAQFVKYLFRLRPKFKQDIERQIKAMGFRKPAVAIHVRRTDKIEWREGGMHSIHEYMKPAIEYFKKLEMVGQLDKRRVYLATDDPSVIKEARFFYPDVQFFVNEDGAKVANYTTRYNLKGLMGLLLDVHVLSRCDYIICTFSSHICRLSYELIQTHSPDAAHRFHSLETLWHTHEASPGFLETIIPHHPEESNQLLAEKGDLLEIWLWHNFSFGFVTAQNLRTLKHGLIPTFKIKDKWEITKFPTYPEVDVD